MPARKQLKFHEFNSLTSYFVDEQSIAAVPTIINDIIIISWRRSHGYSSSLNKVIHVLACKLQSYVFIVIAIVSILSRKLHVNETRTGKILLVIFLVNFLQFTILICIRHWSNECVSDYVRDK